jgi:molybdopterin molybdotransferase
VTEPPASSGAPSAGDGLTSVEAHLADILGTIRPLAPTELSLNDAHGLVLAEDVAASTPLPSFDNSAMDGYAVRVADVAAASKDTPVTLPVVAEIAAGDTGAYSLPEGTSIRIMTGAMLPNGTEAIVPVEWTDGGTARVTIFGRPEYGLSVRLAGGDAKQGEVLVSRGTMLRPMHIAVIAAAGRGAVLVRPRPRVVVLSTGSELAEPGAPIVPGRLPRLPARHRPRQPRRGAAGDRGSARARRPDDHHRRGQHGRRVRRGQGGAAAARHDRVP